MSLRKTQLGFAAVEAFLIVLVLAIVGFTGYKVVKTRNSVDQTYQSLSGSTPAATSAVPTAPNINSASDLGKAETTLNQVNPDDSSSDSSQLDSQLSAF